MWFYPDNTCPSIFEASIPEFCADASLISCSQATIKGNTMSIKVS
jgi:hypothetical protein